MTVSLVSFNHEHWTYIPHAVPNPDTVFDALMSQVGDKVSSYQVSSAYAEGKSFPSRRHSCVFADGEQTTYGGGLPTFPWESSSVMAALRAWVEGVAGTHFDLCLCHLYRDGNDTIGWHRDAEALTTAVASLSLGATRKFRFRAQGAKNGFEEEYDLEGGDLLIMKPTCQRHYVHCVPVQKRVLEPRINLTFRVRGSPWASLASTIDMSMSAHDSASLSEGSGRAQTGLANGLA